MPHRLPGSRRPTSHILGLRPRLEGVTEVDARVVDLCFQLIHVEIRDKTSPRANIADSADMVTDALYTDLVAAESELSSREQWNQRLVGPCVSYLFGVTMEGTSVCVTIDDFRPSFYMQHPRLWSLADSLKLNRDLKLDSVDMVVVYRHALYGWVPSPASPHERDKFAFTRFYFSTPCAMRAAVKNLKSANERAQAKAGSTGRIAAVEYVVSEHQVRPSQMLMQERSLCASGWVRLAACSYIVTSLQSRLSSVQLEVSAKLSKLMPDARDEVAPLLIAAVDIEAHSGDYRSFPDSQLASDVVSYIGTSFYWNGETRPCLRVMQVLGSVEDTALGDAPGLGGDAQLVESYGTEQELLVAWRDLIVVRSDPDSVVSYNGMKFDFNYLFQRYMRLAPVLRPVRFLNMGRLLAELPLLKKQSLNSAAFGDNDLSFFEMPGRYQLDLFMYVKNNYKLSSYKLDAVCKSFLKKELTGKVVLDYPGWVVAETRLAWASCGAPFLQLVGQCINGGCNEASRRVAALFQAAILKAEDVDGSGSGPTAESQVPSVDEDIMDAIGEEVGATNKWIEVNRLLTAAKDACSGLVSQLGGLTGEQRVTLSGLLQQMTPALDASGSDNYRKLFRLYDRGPGERGQIVKYCQVDCDLLIYLMDALSIVQNMVKMSQVTYTLIDDIANRGQQIKVFNLIYRFASTRGFVVNALDVGWLSDAEYLGATVMEPVTGYYTSRIATLDFASLYPSIIRGHNLCYSSLVVDPCVLARRTELEAAGACFSDYRLGGKDWVFQTHTPGILPLILEQLLTARKMKKREMKLHLKDSFAYRLCDAAQLALKVSCNSVYGFTGVLTNGMLTCMPIATATTCIGRSMILKTKDFVEAQGYRVIYGDTDSVMVDTGDVSMLSSFAIGKELARGATGLFPDTVQLEFEKVFCPYLLIKKKMYAGMKYEDSPDLPPKLDVKGLAVVRRDNCQLLRDMLRSILYKVMRDNDPAGAYEVVRAGLAKLVAGTVPLSELEISKSLRATYKDNKQPHLTVVQKMTERREIDVPQTGDRVPFVILQKESNCTDDRIYLRAEHTRHAILAALRIDRSYYLENQLKSHILRLMTPLPVPSVERLFDDAASVFRRSALGVRSICSYMTVSTPNDGPGAPEPEPEWPARLSMVQSVRPAPPSAGRVVQSTLWGSIFVPKVKGKKRTRSPERATRSFDSMLLKK